jgi:CHAT domain-containing protein
VAHLALRGLESPAAAERLLREAIELQERAGLPVLSARTGYLAARVQLAILLGPTAESLSLLRSALAAHLARSRSSGGAPMYSRLALAEFLATSDPPRLEEAMEVSQAAVEHAFLTSGDYEKARTLVLRSRMAFRLGRLSPGRADGLAALDLAERLRDQQHSMPLRLRYAQSLSFAYQSLAGALTGSRGPGDVSALDDSFQVMERLRARGLMETLLVEGTAGEPVQVQPPTLAQVQGELGPSEALLSFQLWQPEPTVDAPYREGSSWVTVITRERVEAFPIQAADGLARRIRAWTGLLERRDGADRMAGARLYGELLRPALAALPPQIDRLIVVPDGPLHRLPFDALSEGPGTPYVAERFVLSIEPSAALWLRFRAAPRQPPGRLLVLADPADAPAAGSVLRGSSGVFGALAHARREAQAALAAFSGGGELRTGPPASEAFLKAAGLKGVSMLHFATHAVTDERDPEHAAVVLAPGSASEDGRLEPGEIARLPLEGKTVVLAGCETSAGPLYRGEGVMSLARAFFGAGATAVVGTLDRARDDEAGVFFSAMYAALGRGASIGDAVSAAKREGIRRGAPPAAWAGVVLLGDGQARPRGGEQSVVIPLSLAGVALAFAGLGASRGLRRGRRRPRGSGG